MIEDIDELGDIMAEPPHGDNHGRVRTNGDWQPLDCYWSDETKGWEPIDPRDGRIISLKRRPQKRPDRREYMRDYMRQYRGCKPRNGVGSESPDAVDRQP